MRSPARADVPSRRAAAAFALTAITLTGLGCWLVGTARLVTVEFGAEGRTGPLPEGTATTAAWGFALVACYGAGLWLGTTAARWVWRTPVARRAVRLAQTATVVAVAAHVAQSLTLLAAAGPHRVAPWVFDLVTATAVLKYGALLPAVVVAMSAAAVLLWRCAAHPGTELARRASHELRTVPPSPLEETDPPAATDSPTTGATRWRNAYTVPGVRPDLVSDRWARGEDTTGVCLSGGGIRAASVALGALQSMRAQLLDAHYLVSVSGGGYTAGALQQALTDAGHPAVAGTVMREPGSAFTEGSAELHHIRRNSSYLANTPGELLGALGRVGRGLLLSLTVLFGPAVVLGVVTGWLYARVPVTAMPLDPVSPPLPRAGAVAAVAALAAAAFLLALFSHGEEARRGRSARYAAELTMLAVVVSVLVFVVPVLLWGSAWLLDHTDTAMGVGGSVGAVLLTYLTTVAAMSWRHRAVLGRQVSGLLRRGKGGVPAALPKGLTQRLLVMITTGLLAVLWLLLFGGAATTSLAPGDSPALVSAAVVAVAVLVLGGVFDVTSLSLHPFYRRRLARAFAVRAVRRHVDDQVVAVPYDPAERTKLSAYGKVAPKLRFPEVVFAASANLKGESRTPPGLGAVSYTMSAEWTGGPDVGWVRTPDLERIVTSRFRRDLTVQGAVAVSGAAFASAMGRSSRWFQVLLAVSGARLGAWLPNPGFVCRAREAAARGDWAHAWLPRARRLPYLLREVFGVHSHQDRLLHVTDGGHYDNLGLVELLRRRCTRIFCVDASNDTPPTATTLAQALTLAAQELGVRVELDEPWRAEPGSAGSESSAAGGPLAARLAANPVITGTIHYPPESGLAEKVTGRLVVARAVLWPELPYPLLSYAAQHPEFPHDSTGDQWFDHGQFCAYTELGRHIGRQAVEALSQRPADTGTTTPPQQPSPTP
ncbi:hypothetical protein FHU38_002657 [Saccharomonospora amisosensis]|uniref:Patatin-like phospholipase n=1 Tax=Saccharomonospora amisosensis TaxID=1128677 RepID=A0A7X5URA1_9PSEU|nr:hypothetical protein [Saccharomonospora amisosensis]